MPTDRLPFLAFADIYNDPDRVASHLFDISQLKTDLASPSTTPNFVWFSADDETNMEGPTDVPFGIFHWALGFLSPAHQYNVAAGDQWLDDQVTTIMESDAWKDPNTKSAIFITFDEDYNNITTGVGNEGNHIVMIVIPSPGAAYDPDTNLMACAQEHSLPTTTTTTTACSAPSRTPSESTRSPTTTSTPNP